MFPTWNVFSINSTPTSTISFEKERLGVEVYEELHQWQTNSKEELVINNTS